MFKDKILQTKETGFKFRDTYNKTKEILNMKCFIM